MKKHIPRHALRLNLETIRHLSPEEMDLAEIRGASSEGLSAQPSRPTTATVNCSYVMTGAICIQ